ncbi:MAG: CidA/LrgA family protein [Parvibaculum sp.]|nr:CidA/LrgA family protein [Parvibaculum sp.]
MRLLLNLALAFVLLVACDSAGKLLVHFTALPVPGTVVGILILLAGLGISRRVPEPLLKVAEFLLMHLNLFYVPAGVGVMAYLMLLADDVWPIVTALFVSTFLAMLAAGVVFQWVARATHDESLDP